MCKEIKGKLINAHYYNCLLSGCFVGDNGVSYELCDLKAICPNSERKPRKFTFKKDKNNKNQDYLEDTCLSILITNGIRLNHELDGSDFENQEETFLYLKEEQ